MANSTINLENEENGLYKRTGLGRYKLATDDEIVSMAAAINASRRRNHRGGSPSKYSGELAKELYELNFGEYECGQGKKARVPIRQLALEYGMSRSTVYRLIKRYHKQKLAIESQ